MSNEMKEYKTIIGREVFQDLVVRAANVLCDPVARTLGPEGLPILLERKTLAPLSTKDGVTVAKAVNVNNELNPIIQAMKEASVKTNTEVGDGTTSAVVLMRELIKEGVRYIKSEAVTPQELVALVKEQEQLILDRLDRVATPIKTKEDQFNVAAISANNDENIAGAIIEALEAAGENGYIGIEEGKDRETVVNFVEGYTLDSGWNKLGPYGMAFVTHPQQGMIELPEPAILIYDGTLTDMNDLAEFFRILVRDGAQRIPLLIIAHGIEGMAYEMMLANRRQGGFIVGIIKVPIYGPSSTKRHILEDLAVLTGGKVINHENLALSNQLLVRNEHGQVVGIQEGKLGSCKRAIVKAHNSIIYGGCGDEQERIKYMEMLKQMYDDADGGPEGNDYDKEFIKLRMSKMVGGVTEIGVGGNSELEMKEKKYRIEDALNATRAAIKEGIVPGGGMALYSIAREVYSGNKTIIDRLLYRVLSAPLKQILNNAGLGSEVILHELCKNLIQDPRSGFDAKNKVYVKDMVEKGIIDPVKVTKYALRNAFSIACELLMEGGMVSFEKARDGKITKEDLLPDLYEGESQEGQLS